MKCVYLPQSLTRPGKRYVGATVDLNRWLSGRIPLWQFDRLPAWAADSGGGTGAAGTIALSPCRGRWR